MTREKLTKLLFFFRENLSDLQCTVNRTYYVSVMLLYYKFDCLFRPLVASGTVEQLQLVLGKISRSGILISNIFVASDVKQFVLRLVSLQSCQIDVLLDCESDKRESAPMFAYT